ncbi:MAG: sodium:solute symporter [Planctomycetota bacterium]
MTAIDWALFVGFLAYVIWDGVRKRRRDDDPDGYFLAGRSVPWWAMGISILATQASAITLIGTTGLGWQQGMRFLQFYLALPIAMLILIFSIVPLYHRLRVTTAYEYLGQRFDHRTRLLAATLFLVPRCLSLGVVIYTPSIILGKVLTIPSWAIIVGTGSIAVLYTSLGGLRAVISTDTKQFAIMIVGLLIALGALLSRLPADIDLGSALRLASVTGHMTIADWRWDPSEKYTMWSSLIGGLFLFLSYFGTDQSQVQRYLAGRSLRDKQGALLLNAVCKLPFQALVLLCGVLLFVFYVFAPMPPTFFPSSDVASPLSGPPAVDALNRLDSASVAVAEAGRALLQADPADTPERARDLQQRLTARATIRAEIAPLAGEENYVFPHFVLHYLPMGLVGLLLAAIFAAALSSVDSELNSMTTVTLVDIAGRFTGPLSGHRLVTVSALVTLLIGGLATTFALSVSRLGSVIEEVNRIGSYVYGSLLGVFVLSLLPKVEAFGAFWGLMTGMIVVAFAARTDGISFLYLNTVGTLTVVAVGSMLSWINGARSRATAR